MSDYTLRNGDRLHDADTIYPAKGAGVRLSLGDAPEVMNAEKQRVAAPGSAEATAATRLAIEEEGYKPTTTGEKDRYGRDLGTIAAPAGGPSAAQEMVADGLMMPGHWKTIDDGGASAAALQMRGAQELTGTKPSALQQNEEYQALVEQGRTARLDWLQERINSGRMREDTLYMAAPKDERKTEFQGDTLDDLGDVTAVAGRSWDRGVDNTQSTLYGFADAFGSATGIDILEKYGEEGVATNVVEAMRNPATVATYEDIEGLADFGIYALEAVAENSPQLLGDLAAGIASGGSATVGKYALAGAGKALLRQAGGPLAISKARELAAKGMLDASARMGFMDAAKAGSIFSMYAQVTGETQNQLVAEGIDSPETALLTGIPKAALDYVGLSTVLRSGLGKVGFKAGMTPQSATELLGRTASSVGIAATTEGLTEATQTLMDELAIKGHKPDYQINMTSIIDAMLKGAIGGGAPVAVTNPVIGAMQYGMRNRNGADTGSGIDTTDPLQEQADRNPLEGIDTVELPSNDSPVTGTEEESEASVKAQIANMPEGKVRHFAAANADTAQAAAAEAGKVSRVIDGGHVQVANTQAELDALPVAPTEADNAALLNYAQTKEEAAADPAGTRAVVVRDAENNVIESQAVGASVADQVVAGYQEQYPNAQVEITTPEAVIEERRQGVAAEKAARAAAPRTLGAATAGVDLTPASPAAVEEAAEEAAPAELLTPKAVQALSDDELRARLEQAELEVVERPTPTGGKTYSPKARTDAAAAVVSRVEKAWGITSNVAVLAGLLGRGEVGKRVQQSEALDMLAEARTPAGRAKIEQALQDDAALADVIDRLSLRGPSYAQQDVVESRIDRLAATRALLAQQASARPIVSESKPAAPVTPVNTTASAKAVGGALAATEEAVAIGAAERRARATRAGLDAPVTEQSQAEGETSVRTVVKDTKTKEGASQDAWESAVLGTTTAEEIDAAARDIGAQAGVGALKARLAAQRQKVNLADVEVAEKYAGDRVAYLMAERGMSEDAAYVALGKSKPKASKVTQSETVQGPAPKQEKDATVPFQQAPSVSAAQTIDESGTTSKGATDGLAAYTGRMREVLGGLTDAGTRLFAALYTPPRMSAERRTDLASDFRDMLESEGLLDRQGKGVQGLAAALIVAARDTASGHTGDVEVADHYEKTEGDEYTKEAIVSHNPQRHLDDIVEMERVAQRLLRGETDARTHQKLVRTALRMLFPATDFGLRRQTNMEIEKDGRDPSEATYAVDNTAAASRMLGAEDANQHAEELFQDLLLERLAEELMGGADSVGDITPSLNAVSTRGAVALRGNKTRHAAALGAINQPLVDAYRAAIALDMVLHAKEDPEFGLTMPQLRELLRDPGTRDMALGALRARLQGMPSAAQMQEAIDATLATQGPGTNESNAANAKGVARGAAHRGDEELSNSVFGYFMNRAVAWIEAVTGLGQRYKRAGAEPRVFDTHTVVALDSETYYEEGGYSLRNIRPGAYVDDPRFRVHFWTVRRPGDAEATVLRTPGEVKDYLAKLRAEAAQSGKPLLLAAHNAAFDARVLNKAYGIELQEGERWVDTVSLFRAAVPQSGVTKESPRPSHRLELLAARLREAGVTGIDEKDSAANTAASGKRMPWHEGSMEAVTDDELAAFEDYAKNDTSVVLAALDHFDPSPAFVDLSNAETAIRRGLPGSATGLMAAMGQHGVVPAVGFGKMNDSSRRMTTAASANNLMPVTLVEGNVPRDVFVDMAALAHYSQSGEHRPGNVLEAYQNLTANLSRMMAADPDTTAGDRMRAVPHIEPMILPDSLVIHFAEGKPLTVADARRAEAQQIRDGATRAETPRVRAQEQMKVAVIDQSIEVLVDERMALEAETTASSPANEEALELISRRASGELKGSEAARLASLAGDKVKAAYYAILRAKMKVATGMPSMLRAVGIDIPADAAVDLDMLFSLRGDSLATLRDIKVRDTVARDLATVSDVQDDKTEDVLLAEARAEEGYDEVDMSMRRRARIDADRAWMEEGAESPQARGNDYGTPQLESRRMEDDIQLEGEQATRERMANPAQLPGYVPPQHSAAPKVAPEPVSTIGAPTRRTKGDSDFRNLTGRETAAIERMISTLDGFAAKQVQAVRDLLSRVAERGVPVLGATLIPLHQGGMVEGAPERVLNRMGITPTPELVAALREGRSFYVLTRSGPVIGVANFGASPNGRARMLNDLAHELGHMVRDRVWKSMDAPTREAISLDFAADHPEQLTKEQRAAAEHEWFANRMAGAVLSTLKTATEGVSHPVARLMGKMYSAARQLWAGLNAALGRSQAFDKFALELFAGTYRDAGTTTRLATDGAMEIYNADGYERVRKQATGKLQMAKGGAVSAWKKGVLPAIRSALANVATRIEHFDPLLSRQLFQGANANSTGKRAFEQDYRAIRSRLRGAIEKAMLTFESEDAFRQAFDDLIQGRDTAGAKTVGTLIEGLQTSAREAGLRSVLFRAKEPPMVFDRERVEHNRVEFEHMLLRAGLTPLQVRETVTGIVEGEHAIEMSIAPGVSVGDHGSNHLLGQRLDRAKLQAEGWLLDRHAEALMHWADAVAKRAAWDTAFGEYMTAGGAEAAARTYFGTHRVTASQVAQLREAGMIDDAGRLFHTNHKFVQRLDLIERVHGSAARQEVMDLTLGALGKHPAGQRMPKWVRNSQDFVLGWIGKTMLVYSGLMSLPEPALAFARAGGTVGLGDSFRSFGEARRFARDMGIVLSDSAEYMAFQGEQYQSTAMRKFDHWFFKLNGNQAVTNFSRVMATNIAIRYLHSAVETGDVAALERLNVTAEQVEIWEAKGRPAWATHLDPSTRGIAAAVGDAINQFVQEASLQPSRFQATHWGNNPYMRALWQLKHFLFTTGSTLVAGTYREMARRFKDGDMVAAAVPLILFGVVAMPLAMAAGEARDWLRRLNGQRSEFEDPVLDRVIGGVRRTGIFGPAEIGLGIWKQVEWGNGPLAALSPAFSVAQRVYGKVLPGETMDGTPKDADYEEALRLLIPLMSQNKGLWEMLAK